MSFIGRGENRARSILMALFPLHNIYQQVEIQKCILQPEYDSLSEELKKHKFDFMFSPINPRHRILVVEVNYKHGPKAVKKWEDHFKPALLRSGKNPIAINDFECKSLFDTREERPLRWEDYTDIINAIQMAGVKPYQ